MFAQKFFRGLVAALIVGGSLFLSPAVQAETKTYTGVGEYVMGERDTLETAKQGAKDKALRNALERAGVLIQTRSRTEDLELVEDEITSQTGAVLKVIEVVYERKDLLIRATVQVDIDAEDLNRRLELYNSPDADKISLASKKLEEASRLWSEDKTDEALELLDEAATLNPKDVKIFSKRAIIYVGLGQYANASRDAEKILQLDPTNAPAFWIRGAANLSFGDNVKGLEDLNESIRLDPKSKYAYYFRGIYWKNVGDKKLARADFLRAKELGFYGSVAKKFLEENP